MENGAGGVDARVVDAGLRRKKNKKGGGDSVDVAHGLGGRFLLRIISRLPALAHVYFERGMFALKVGPAVWGLYYTARGGILARLRLE